MPVFEFDVIKRMYVKGTIKVEGEFTHQAMDKLQQGIDSGEIQTTDAEWGTPQYEDFTFEIDE